MIIANGTIEAKVKTGGGLNEAGYPVAPSVAWGSPIPCQYRANSFSNVARVNGESYTLATYEVLIDGQPFEAEQLRLKNSSGGVVGEYPIIEIEPLDAVCQVRIRV